MKKFPNLAGIPVIFVTASIMPGLAMNLLCPKAGRDVFRLEHLINHNFQCWLALGLDYLHETVAG